MNYTGLVGGGIGAFIIRTFILEFELYCSIRAVDVVI